MTKSVAVVGAGPAGLMAADVLSARGVAVTVYDRMPSVGRKFLLAGRGGLNLTHSEALDLFLSRYGAARPHLEPAIKRFPPDALRAFSASHGQETFVGSSGRVFPKALKASPLLRAWLRSLDARGVVFRLRHHWRGWSEAGELVFDSPAGLVASKPDATVLALGGASWPRLGSDGGWADVLRGQGISIAPLQPANAGFEVAWSERFRIAFEGQPLKNIALAYAGHAVRGEAVVTRSGLEGGAVYALSPPLREAILRDGVALLKMSLRPDLDQTAMTTRLERPRGKQSLSNFLRKAVGLPPVSIGLIREAAISGNVDLPKMPAAALAAFINDLPIRLSGIRGIDRAISTAGGVALSELDERFMLRHRHGLFVAGEMLDWEAPTGGYLLQACFATGVAAAQGALDWLAEKPSRASLSSPA
jgi:uncharacterized flavoprotein (TIGR03862 family)